MEKIGRPKANLGPPHKYADNPAYLMLITPKVPEYLEVRLSPKAWPSI